MTPPYPSRRPIHDGTANASVALLDAAWSGRARGDRQQMRALARSAVAWIKLSGRRTPTQLKLFL